MDQHRRTESARTAVLLVGSLRLRSDARRVAAAADCDLDEPTGALGRSAWDAATVVMLDASAARQMVTVGLPRRPGIVVLADGTPGLEDWQVATELGAEHVCGLPEEEQQLIRILGEGSTPASDSGGVIAVVGARGGAGASTFATALAVSSSTAGVSTMLIDGDAYGSGLDLLLGWEDLPGLRWSGLSVEAGRISADALHDALVSGCSGLCLLSRDGRESDKPVLGLSATAAAAVVDAGRMAGDIVICDVMRHRCAESDAFLDAADMVVLILPAELRSISSGHEVKRYALERNSNIGVVVRGPSPGGLRAEELADALNLPLLAFMRPEPGLPAMLERGGLAFRRRSALASAAEMVLEAFELKPHARSWAS